MRVIPNIYHILEIYGIERFVIFKEIMSGIFRDTLSKERWFLRV